MLYTVDQLNENALQALDLLDDCMYLSEEESFFHPQSIPIISYNNYPTVHYNYLDQLTEEFGYSIDEALSIICEANNINNVTLLIPDYELISNPWIVNETSNIVLLPISEDSLAYQFCEACIDAYAESGDETWLEALLEEREIEKLFTNAGKAREEIQDARVGGNSNQSYEDDIRERYTRDNAQVVSGGMKEAIKQKVAQQQPYQPKNAQKATLFQKGIKMIKNAPTNAKVKYQRLGRDVKAG